MAHIDKSHGGRGARLRRQGGQVGAVDDAGETIKPGKLRLFHDVAVVPTRSLYCNNQLSDGGPIWSNFEARQAIRHHRKGKVIDHAPEPRGAPYQAIDQPCIWGGFAMLHFGHLVAEHLSRVLESVTERPGDTFLFTAKPGEDAGQAPEYFWTILAWYGVPRAQVMFVTEPLQVAELRVMPQAEQMGYGEPSEAYVDLLDLLPQARGLVPVVCDILYVARTGLLQGGKGGHAGEAYVVDRLLACGVRVLDPAQVPLLEQLALYAGARVIVFAEGSAVHGRQLLGRLPQDIYVLKRRPDKDIGLAMLDKRCKQLRYVETAARFVAAASRSGHVYDAKGISFYDLKQLHGCFLGLGVDLKAGWSDTAYLKARDCDAIAWLTAIRGMVTLTRKSRMGIAEEFRHEGLTLSRLAFWWIGVKVLSKAVMTRLTRKT